MIIYFIQLLSIPIIIQTIKQKEKIRNLIIFLILFIPSAIRDISIGADNSTYKFFFLLYGKYSWKEVFRSTELGYVLLNKIVYIFSTDFRTLIVVISFISTIGVVWFATKYSKDLTISLFLYVCMFYYISTFTFFRQAIAMTLIFLAYDYAQNKTPFKFVLAVIMASLFHNTAIVCLLIYPLIHVKLKKVHLLFLVPLLFLGIYFRDSIFNIVWSIVGGRYNYYSNNFSSGSGQSMLLLDVVILAFVIISMFGLKQREEFSSYEKQLMLWLAGMTTFLQGIALSFALMNRMTQYFAIPLCILLPNLIKSSFKYKDKLLVKLVLMIFGVAFFYYQLKISPESIVPYKVMKF